MTEKKSNDLKVVNVEAVAVVKFTPTQMKEVKRITDLAVAQALKAYKELETVTSSEATKAPKKQATKKVVYIREYTEDTRKHLKGIKLELTEDNIKKQFLHNFKDEASAKIKDLNSGKEVICTANSSKYYKIVKETTKKTTKKAVTKNEEN